MNTSLKDKIFNSFYKDTYLNIDRSVCYRNRKFYYNTSDKCKDEETTFKELFEISNSYLNTLIKEYKNFKIARQIITNSCFKIRFYYRIKEEKSPINYAKTIYDLELDYKSGNVLYEYKNDVIENNNLKIIINCVDISVKLYNYNKPFLYDGEKQPLISNVCILCNKNKSSVLITKCRNLVFCNDCDNHKSISECPYCKRYPINSEHKIKFPIIDSISSFNENTEE